MASQTFTAAQVLTAAQMNTLANTVDGYATTATAAGTTTLTVASYYQQYFTGATTQTVVMPVASTLVVGWKIRVVNNSSGIVTVQSSGANTIYAVPAGGDVIFTCILASGTTAASWDYKNHISSSSGGITLLSTTTLSGASTTISSISGSYKNLQICWNGTTDTSATIYIKPNGTSSICSYAGVRLTNTATTGSNTDYNPSGSGELCGTTQSGGVMNIYEYAGTSTKKAFNYAGQTDNNHPTFSGGMFEITAAITSIVFSISSGTFTGGTVRIYGVN